MAIPLVGPTQLVSFCVHGRDGEDIPLSLPAPVTTGMAKEALRQKLGRKCPHKVRLARRTSPHSFAECGDSEPLGQDLRLLDPDMASTAEAQLQRELGEALAEEQLKCCSVRKAGALALDVHVELEEGGSAALHVQCHEDHPFTPCSIDVTAARDPMGEEGWCGLLGKGPLVGPSDTAWIPDFTLKRLLLGIVNMMGTWPGFLFSSLLAATAPFLDSDLRVVYISIGCGGPFLAQQIPRAVQRLHAQRGGRCLLVLLDPLLTYPAKPRNEWLVAHERGAVVCLCNALVEDWDIEGLEEFISRVAEAGVARDCLILADHRGASFMCAPCPIGVHLAPEVQAKFCSVSHDEDVCMDDCARLVLRAVHGVSGGTRTEREATSAMARRDSSLSFGHCSCTSRELGLLTRVERHGTQARTQLPSELLLMA